MRQNVTLLTIASGKTKMPENLHWTYQLTGIAMIFYKNLEF